MTEAILARLQNWYAYQCDGDWEHQYGVSIGTLDNPGWELSVDLAGTHTDPNGFPPYRDHRTEHDWVEYRIDGEMFRGFGGPQNLEELLTYFLDRVGG